MVELTRLIELSDGMPIRIWMRQECQVCIDCCINEIIEFGCFRSGKALISGVGIV